MSCLVLGLAPATPTRSYNVRRNWRSAAVSKFNLPPLPYEMDALEPFMSRKTLEFHWGKHHRAYIDNLNKQIAGTQLQELKLSEVVTRTYNNGNPEPSFNNAAQAWNHEFFFNSMKPSGGKAPDKHISELIDRDFNSYSEFVKQFKLAATSQFGSGWAWLILKDEKLVIEKTSNAITPIVFGQTPLLVLDVWEHAYYLDFQNRRPDYIDTFLNKLVDWEAVNTRLELANSGDPSQN